jgi:hypothetical protein
MDPNMPEHLRNSHSPSGPDEHQSVDDASANGRNVVEPTGGRLCDPSSATDDAYFDAKSLENHDGLWLFAERPNRGFESAPRETQSTGCDNPGGHNVTCKISQAVQIKFESEAEASGQGWSSSKPGRVEALVNTTVAVVERARTADGRAELPRFVQVQTMQTASHKMQTYCCAWRECDYTSRDLANIRRHIRGHTAERPFKCTHPNCTYNAAQREHLQRHQLTHDTRAAKKGFECPHTSCDYASNRRDHLQRHLRSRAHNFGRSQSRGCCPICTSDVDITNIGQWHRRDGYLGVAYCKDCKSLMERHLFGLQAGCNDAAPCKVCAKIHAEMGAIDPPLEKRY